MGNKLMRLTLASSGEYMLLSPLHVVAVMPPSEWGGEHPKTARALVLVTGQLGYCVREDVGEVQRELTRCLEAGFVG